MVEGPRFCRIEDSLPTGGKEPTPAVLDGWQHTLKALSRADIDVYHITPRIIGNAGGGLTLVDIGCVRGSFAVPSQFVKRLK